MTQPLLSILILTVPRRLTTAFASLTSGLLTQAEGKPVEILALFDNHYRSVGEKRNALLDLARGKYLAFVDDDDRVAPDYIDSILAAARDNPQADVIVFDQIMTRLNCADILCRFGVELPRAMTHELITCHPTHTMAWRAELAKRHRFPAVNLGEDFDWSERASGEVRVQARIDRALYFYNFCIHTSETRSARRNEELAGE